MGAGDDDEALLGEHREQLRRIREEGVPGSAPHGGTQNITTAAEDGSVRVVTRGRRLVRVEIAAERSGAARRDVTEALRDTINRALVRALSESPRAGDPGPDLAAVGDELTSFAEQSGAVMRRVQGALEQNVAKLSGGNAAGKGDAAPQQVEHLYADVLDVVRSMQSALADTRPEPARGEGQDASEEVAAVVQQGELTRLTLTSFALRMAPGDLDHAVTDAVNDALLDWEQATTAAARPDVDTAALQQLSDRADAIRTQSMRHLRTYTDSVSSIMRDAD